MTWRNGFLYPAVLGLSFGVWQWDVAAGGWMALVAVLLIDARWGTGRRDPP